MTFSLREFFLEIGAILSLLIAQSADITRFVSGMGKMSAQKVCIASFGRKIAQTAMLPHKRSQQHYRALPSNYRALPSNYRATTEHYRATTEHYRATTEHYRATTEHYRALPSNYRALPSNYRAPITLLWAVLSSLVAKFLAQCVKNIRHQKSEILGSLVDFGGKVYFLNILHPQKGKI